MSFKSTEDYLQPFGSIQIFPLRLFNSIESDQPLE